VSVSSRELDRLEASFDHDGIVANAGLVVPATLMVRLGLETLIDTWVSTGSARPGRKILTVVAAMLAGGTHIDHVNMLRAGATQRVLPFKVMAPSTIGTFLRSFTFGHVRQLDAVCSRGRCCVEGNRCVAWRWRRRGRKSDRSCEFVERGGDAQPGERVDGEFVVAAPEVLHERVAPDHH